MGEPIGRQEFNERMRGMDDRLREVETTANENTGQVDMMRERRNGDLRAVKLLGWLVLGIPSLLALLALALKALGK